MRPRSARLLALVPVVWLTLVAPARALDVGGNWQTNIDCGIGETASILFHLDQDSASGAVTANMTDCGTFQVPGAIRRPSSCVLTPSVIIGQIDRGSLELPASDYYASDALTPPFSFGSCSAATEIVSAHHLHGIIQTDEAANVVGIAGTWANGAVDIRDATGTSCFSLTAPPTCTFDMRRSDVAPGTNVTVSPHVGVTVTFEEVTTPGMAWAMPLTQAEASVPAQFQLLGNVPIFFDVHTTAGFSGTITTCFSYPDVDRDGIVDGTIPPLDESFLRVLHAEDGTFVDRTVSLDTTAKVVCGATQSLSQLVVAHPPGATTDSGLSLSKMTMRRGKSGRTATHLVSYANFPPPADDSEDPRTAGASLEVFSRMDPTVVRFEMPAVGWKKGRVGKYTVYRFSDRLAKTSAVTHARLASWLQPGIRVVSPTIGLPLGAPQGAVAVRLTVGSRRYCDVFYQPTIDRPQRLHVSGYGTHSGDCADRRIRAALAP